MKGFSVVVAIPSEASSHGRNCVCVNVGLALSQDLANEEQAIFCIASYGEGEPTDNARDSFEYLLEKASPEELSGLRFTVIPFFFS